MNYPECRLRASVLMPIWEIPHNPRQSTASKKRREHHVYSLRFFVTHLAWIACCNGRLNDTVRPTETMPVGLQLKLAYCRKECDRENLKQILVIYPIVIAQMVHQRTILIIECNDRILIAFFCFHQSFAKAAHWFVSPSALQIFFNAVIL